MIKKIIISLVIIAIIGSASYVYLRYFAPLPYEEFAYTSISVLRKNDNLSLGEVKTENKKVITNIDEPEIKRFVDENKDRWEKEELSHPIGGQTITGGLWDGIQITTINDNNHLLSIYTLLSNEFNDKYSFKLNRTKKFGTRLNQ